MSAQPIERRLTHLQPPMLFPLLSTATLQLNRPPALLQMNETDVTAHLSNQERTRTGTNSTDCFISTKLNCNTDINS
ncbi:hypothetical protein TNCV_4410381 [Trichonephila clavipes]|nr:hypothetical protein TNCV_4410381 [Trichonephila clavipes]